MVERTIGVLLQPQLHAVGFDQSHAGDGLFEKSRKLSHLDLNVRRAATQPAANSNNRPAAQRQHEPSLRPTGRPGGSRSRSGFNPGRRTGRLAGRGRPADLKDWRHSGCGSRSDRWSTQGQYQPKHPTTAAQAADRLRRSDGVTPKLDKPELRRLGAR